MGITLEAENLFHIGSFGITNTLVAIWIVAGILIVFAFIINAKIAMVPRGLQNIFEIMVEFFLGLIRGVTGDESRAKKFFPLVMTIFLYIMLNNYLGLLPGVGTIGIEENGHLVHFLRSANSDLNMTLALAVIAVLATHVFGIASLGFFQHVGKFINLKSLLKNPIFFFVGLLELISEVSKVVSFSFRLFGNVFAGEVLLVVIASLVPFIAPVPFYMLEIFVGFIQALVFSMLTLVFLTIATEHVEH